MRTIPSVSISSARALTAGLRRVVTEVERSSPLSCSCHSSTAARSAGR
ncbi:MAG TPA: hypothetical protein VF715_04930 [Thermoleophilaceae bacterium]